MVGGTVAAPLGRQAPAPASHTQQGPRGALHRSPVIPIRARQQALEVVNLPIAGGNAAAAGGSSSRGPVVLRRGARGPSRQPLLMTLRHAGTWTATHGRWVTPGTPSWMRVPRCREPCLLRVAGRRRGWGTAASCACCAAGAGSVLPLEKRHSRRDAAGAQSQGEEPTQPRGVHAVQRSPPVDGGLGIQSVEHSHNQPVAHVAADGGPRHLCSQAQASRGAAG